jgi:hypothetical protein
MLAGFRANAARDRDKMRARAERAESQADAYHDELAQVRLRPAMTDTATGSGTPRRTRQATQP